MNIEYNSKQIEKNNYKLLSVFIILSCFLFTPILFEKYLILYSFVSATLISSVYLKNRIKLPVLLVSFIVEILDSGIVGLSQVTYMLTVYVRKHFYTRFQNTGTTAYSFFVVILAKTIVDLGIKHFFDFTLNYDLYVFSFLYTYGFCILIMKIMKDNEQRR
jgi:hypothetical protein